MADVTSPLAQWSTTASNNSPIGSANVGSGVDNNFREIQAVVRAGLAHYNPSPVASSGTTDIGAATGNFLDISGTSTITAFDSVSAGIWKVCRFTASLTLTHNATTLILPGGANITTEAGDVAWFYSLGSGNWRCAVYSKVSGTTVVVAPIGGATGLTTETSIAVDDYLPIWDTSAAANRKITVQNVLNGVGLLTAETSVATDDSVLLYDTSASTTERTTVSSLATAILSTSGTMATQADMETATSTTTVVSPGRTHYHPRVAKYWCRVHISGGTASISEQSPSGGSVSRTGTGFTAVTLPVTMTSSSYAAIAGVTSTGAGFIRVHSTTTTQVFVSTQNSSGADVDLDYALVVFGDL